MTEWFRTFRYKSFSIIIFLYRVGNCSSLYFIHIEIRTKWTLYLFTPIIVWSEGYNFVSSLWKTQSTSQHELSRRNSRVLPEKWAWSPVCTTAGVTPPGERSHSAVHEAPGQSGWHCREPPWISSQKTLHCWTPHPRCLSGQANTFNSVKNH